MVMEKVMLEKEKLKTCLTCPICHDFFDRATTISECLHTFCRKCIHDKIIDKNLNACPVCNVDLGGVPLEKLRPDHSLQDLRLKLFPANGRNRKAETETSPAPLSTSRRKELSLSSLIISSSAVSSPRSNADTTETSMPDRRNDCVGSVIVEMPGEKAEDAPRIKISSRGLAKYRSGKKKSRPSPVKNDMQMDFEGENYAKIQSASKMQPDIAQDKRSIYESVPSEGNMQEENITRENEAFSINLWKPLSCLAEAADRTKIGKSNEQKNTRVFEQQLNAREDGACIEQAKEINGQPTRDDDPNQMTVEPVVPSNGQEDGKSATDKAKNRSNGKGSPHHPPLRPRESRKLLGVRQKDETVPETTTMEANNEAEGRNIPVWFSLVASENQGTRDPLPQISSCYLRVKDANLPVSFIKKYLVKKLNLASEAEVEISLRGKPLHSSQRLQSLVEWWIQTTPVSERISPSLGGSAKDFVMVLSYGRKYLL